MRHLIFFILLFFPFSFLSLYGQSGYTLNPEGISFQGLLFADKLNAARREFAAQGDNAVLRSVTARALNQEGLSLLCESFPELASLELLYSPDISDLGYLRSSGGLLELKLQGLEQIKDLQTLPELPALQKLQLTYLPLQSLQGLSRMTRLNELDLELPALTDFDSLAEIKRLEILKIKAEDLGDLKFLQSQRRLLRLELSSADFNNIEALQKLTRLRILRLANTAESKKNLSLKFLNDCRNISHLQLSNFFLQDAESLQALTGLAYLDLSGCQGLESLEPLRNLPLLRTVKLPQGNFKPEDLGALRKGVNIISAE